MSCGFSALLALRILNDLLASEIVSGKVKISKRNLPVPRMWLVKLTLYSTGRFLFV